MKVVLGNVIGGLKVYVRVAEVKLIHEGSALMFEIDIEAGAVSVSLSARVSEFKEPTLTIKGEAGRLVATGGSFTTLTVS